MATLEGTQIQNAWDRIASGYDTLVTPRNTVLADRAFEAAGLRTGDRFLDVAAGSGALALPAARLGARVLATDISPAMIGRLDARARDEGLTNLETAVMDGQALDLDDDTFDVTASQFGVMLFPDLPRGLAEMARVTKPGGRVVVVAFAPPPTVEFLTFFMGAAKATVPGFTGLPVDPPPLPFQVSNPDVLHGRLQEAGLRDIRITAADHVMEFRSGAELYDAVANSNPIGTAIASGFTTEQRSDIEHVLDGMLRERSGGGPAVLHNATHIGAGVK